MYAVLVNDGQPVMLARHLTTRYSVLGCYRCSPRSPADRESRGSFTFGARMDAYLVGERGPEVLSEDGLLELDTVGAVDEALMHASLVPPRERGPAWRSFVDKLTDLRKELTA